MNTYVAIDAGGTKTEAILAAEDGSILTRLRRPGCNPMDHGVPAVQKAILAVVEELLAAAPSCPISLYGGIAGLDRIETGLTAFLRQHTPIPVIRTEDDGCNMISGTLGHVDGCGLVCGTGSSLFARIEGKPLVHIGGLGYLIDTGGSGFSLAQAGLKRAYRYLDGRDDPTLLPELFREATGIALKDAFQEIYGGGRPYIASLAHLVFEGAALGDAACLAILDQGSTELAELTHAAAKHFSGDFSVVMSGGILTAYPHYAEAVRQKASPRARLQLAEVPPIYGALVEALWQNGVTADGDTRARFMADYKKITQ